MVTKKVSSVVLIATLFCYASSYGMSMYTMGFGPGNPLLNASNDQLKKNFQELFTASTYKLNRSEIEGVLGRAERLGINVDNVINGTNTKGVTPLYMAARNKGLTGVHALLELGADATFVTNDGKTLLEAVNKACDSYREFALFGHVKGYKINPNKFDRAWGFIDPRTKDQQSLEDNDAFGYMEIVKALCANGAYCSDKKVATFTPEVRRAFNQHQSLYYTFYRGIAAAELLLDNNMPKVLSDLTMQMLHGDKINRPEIRKRIEAAGFCDEVGGLS